MVSDPTSGDRRAERRSPVMEWDASSVVMPSMVRGAVVVSGMMVTPVVMSMAMGPMVVVAGTEEQGDDD